MDDGVEPLPELVADPSSGSESDVSSSSDSDSSSTSDSESDSDSSSDEDEPNGASKPATTPARELRFRNYTPHDSTLRVSKVAPVDLQKDNEWMDKELQNVIDNALKNQDDVSDTQREKSTQFSNQALMQLFNINFFSHYFFFLVGSGSSLHHAEAIELGFEA